MSKDNKKDEKAFAIHNVIGSGKSLAVEDIKEFIEHWQRIITPVDLEHPEKRAIHTIITELETYTRTHCR